MKRTSTMRTRQKEETGAEILRSAQRLFRTQGFSRTSVARVMKGAGLTVGGFYAHFRSKQALVAHAVQRTMAEMRERLTAGLSEKSPRRRLAGALERYLSAEHRDRPEEGCPMPATLGEIARGGAPLRRLLATELEEHARALGGTTDRDTAMAALALMVGGLSLSRAVAGTPLSDEILAACVRFGRAALAGRDGAGDGPHDAVKPGGP